MLSCSRSPRSVRPPTLLTALALAALGLPPASAQTAVLTQNNDNARTGANTAVPLWHDVLPLSATYTTATPVID